MNARNYTRQNCSCGQPAVTRSANDRCCQRCADLTASGEVPMTSGRPERQPRWVGWVEFRARCNGWLERAGLETRFQ